MRFPIAIRSAALLISLITQGFSQEPLSSLRYPVDAEWVVPGQWLVTANSRSGTLSVVDLVARRIAHEELVGGAPKDVLRLKDGRLALLDSQRNELRLLHVKRDPWMFPVDAIIPTKRDPQTVISLRAGLISVASLWDRCVERFEIEGTPATLEASRMSVELSFAPRCQLVLPGGEKLLVADNFGGHLAIIDIVSWTIESVRTLNAHNIRGLAVSQGEHAVLVAHQLLNQQVTTGLDAVRDGILMQNVVRVVPLDKLYDAEALLPVHTRTIFLGRPVDGAADPSDLVLDSR